LDNFVFVLQDPEFWKALRNTATFAAGSLFLQVPVALGLALLLNHPRLLGRSLFRFVFFSPYLLGQVFTAVMFGLLFAPHYGLINQALHLVFPWVSTEIEWLGRPHLVMPALILTALWMYAGFNMVYFLAALQTVDRDLIDAASIDGAGAWNRFWHVTFPAIQPVLVFVLVLSTIGSLQLFELPYLMLSGPGPEGAGMTLVMYLYQRGFVAGDLGFASAVGWILALLTLGLSVVQLRARRPS
jgi:ABC-type sugar transport system permease subunit